MDLASIGTNSHHHAMIPTKPNKPPPVAKKPTLNRKPPVAVKPILSLSTSQSVNGDSFDSVSQGTPDSSPVTTSNAKPKDPPPPLPKVSPKGPAKNNPPPPLPKTSPRGPGGIRTNSTNQRHISAVESSKNDSIKKSISNGVAVDTATSEPPVFTEPNIPETPLSQIHNEGKSSWYVPPKSELTLSSDCEPTDRVEVATGNSGEHRDILSASGAKTDTESLSSWYVADSKTDGDKVSTEVTSQQSDSVKDEQSTRASLKGSPSRKLVKSDAVCEEEEDNSCICDGNVNVENESSLKDTEKSESVLQKFDLKSQVKESTVDIVVDSTANKVSSGKFKKTPPSRAPPPPPPKRSPPNRTSSRFQRKPGSSLDFTDSENDLSVFSNEMDLRKADSSPLKSLCDSEKLQQKDFRPPDSQNVLTEQTTTETHSECQTLSDRQFTEGNSESTAGGSPLVPIPRARPTPKPRVTPKPTPRRSINRLSGSDFPSPDFMTTSQHNLSCDLEQLQTVDINIAKTGDINRAKSEENVSGSPKKSKFSGPRSPLKSTSVASRFFETDSGDEKEYKVINKSSESLSNVSRSSSTEGLDKAVLRKNFEKKIAEDQPELSSDISVLRNRFESRSPSPSAVVKSPVLKKKSPPKTPAKPSPKSSPKHSPKLTPKPPPKSVVVTEISTRGIDDNTKILQREETVSDKESESENSFNKSTKSSGSSKGSFEDLLADKSILEPSSLLTEIEEILFRSYKMSSNSLTRSGSSPEKKPYPVQLRSPTKKYERSLSLDTVQQPGEEKAPIRPPRPKKEQRIRTRSQIVYDSAGSDTESLSEFRSSLEESGHYPESKYLGPAKPHPPKPKRHKLLTVQRSQSDVTAMKSFVEEQEKHEKHSEARRSPHKRQRSDVGMSNMEASPSAHRPNNFDVEINPETGRPKSWRRERPSRKAPPPPPVAPFRHEKPSGRNTRLSLDMVVPVSKNITGKSKKSSLSDDSSSGTWYHSIDDAEAPISSDDSHDYIEIPDSLSDLPVSSQIKSISKPLPKTPNPDISKQRAKSLQPPPRLPPRNPSNSFESSSPSSIGHDNEFADEGYLEPEVGLQIGAKINGKATPSPRSRSLKPFPQKSSPNTSNGLRSSVPSGSSQGLASGHSNLSLTDSLEGSSVKAPSRPVSGLSQCSIQSDSGSHGSHGSHMQAHSSSESEDDDDEQKKLKKRERKLRKVATEVMTSERVFVDILVLLNVDFRQHLAKATETLGRPVIPNEVLNNILKHLDTLMTFNEELLSDLEKRVESWETNPNIADIFLRKGPFLKMYSTYYKDFESITASLDDAVKKFPHFQKALKEFEMSDRCAKLAVKHYMLKPIQRIPQYRLLLKEYMKHLPEDSTQLNDMQKALVVVSEVASHANETIKQGDYIQKMLEIQRSLIGQFEVIKPGRIFLKEGELMKVSRKEKHPRFFFLFNDVLVYTDPGATGYRFKNALALAGMKVNVASEDEFKTEFSVIAVQRSFTLSAETLEERNDWVSSLTTAIEVNIKKRSTIHPNCGSSQDSEISITDKDFKIGHQAPLMIPDDRVSMCMLCTCDFTITWRRHHCRACGKVVCGNCSDNKAPLRYKKNKKERVCYDCYDVLQNESQAEHKKKHDKEDKPKGALNISAIDPDADMKGYLWELQEGHKWNKTWFLLKASVLYNFNAINDGRARKNTVMLSYNIERPEEAIAGTDPSRLFQLKHLGLDTATYMADGPATVEKWVNAIKACQCAV